MYSLFTFTFGGFNVPWISRRFPLRVPWVKNTCSKIWLSSFKLISRNEWNYSSLLFVLPSQHCTLSTSLYESWSSPYAASSLHWSLFTYCRTHPLIYFYVANIWRSFCLSSINSQGISEVGGESHIVSQIQWRSTTSSQWLSVMLSHEMGYSVWLDSLNTIKYFCFILKISSFSLAPGPPFLVFKDANWNTGGNSTSGTWHPESNGPAVCDLVLNEPHCHCCIPLVQQSMFFLPKVVFAFKNKEK